MDDRRPTDLIRLRSATAAYLTILRESFPVLEGIASVADADEPGPTTRLLESVQAAAGLPDQPGTVSNIAHLLDVVLGER